MTHGKPCVKMHVLTRHMGSHVSTCMSFELCIKGGGGGGGGGGKKRKGGNEKRKREKKEKKGKR